jgi:hypothetical protein
MRPEEHCPTVFGVLSIWRKTGRPVKEEVFVLIFSEEGFQQGLVFWSKAERLESEFGEASKEGEIGGWVGE